MADRTIASRPSLEQVVAIVDFMEKHPALALGQLRGLEGRDQSKKLWAQLTKMVNNINGPKRPMKSWVKYWADKKSTVRLKVQQSCGGDPNMLGSNIERKLWDLFLANDTHKSRNLVKQEAYLEESFFAEESIAENHVETEPVMAFEDPAGDFEERQFAVMDKLVGVCGAQATALSSLARASAASAQALQRMADAQHLQARAIDRLATTFESIGAATHDARTAIVDIDTTMKRFYTTSPT